MKKICLLFLLFATSAYSQVFDAGDYEYLTTSSDNKKVYYYKIDNHSEVGNQTDIWFKIVTKPSRKKNKKGKLITIPGEYTVNHITIKCTSNTFDMEEYVVYNFKDEVKESGNHNLFDDRIFPDTLMETLKNHVCE